MGNVFMADYLKRKNYSEMFGNCRLTGNKIAHVPVCLLFML